MSSLPLRLVHHLYWRTGMGLRPDELRERTTWTYEALLDEVFAEPPNFNTITTAHVTTTYEQLESRNVRDKALLRRQSRAATLRLNALWRQRMLTTPGCLREKMALFWHGHFASWCHWSIGNEQYLDILRRQGLGDFRILLKSISRSASILDFLGNKRNTKDAPNENFAREVMELFTLGHGNYTEQDIHEAARAFTGWSFKLESGAFWFRTDKHDFGEKTFRGSTGPFDGDDVLDLIVKDKACARFIARKIYRWFVDPTPDEAFIATMADRFHASGYDITDLMRSVLASDHFRDAAHFGTRVKSPVELMAGLDKQFNIRFELESSAIDLQRQFGQVLLYPPNVAGWHEGTAWIDSNSLLQRMKLPAALVNKGQLDREGGSDPLENDMRMGDEGDAPLRDTRGRVLHTAADTHTMLARLPEEATDTDLFAYFLLVDPSERLRMSIGSGAPLERVLEVMSSPEYQLC